MAAGEVALLCFVAFALLAGLISVIVAIYNDYKEPLDDEHSTDKFIG